MFFQPRQFPRMKLELAVRVDCFDRWLTATSVEVGSGGMSLKKGDSLSVSQPVQLSFVLPNGQPVVIQAVIWWKRAELLGVRFDPSDRNRLIVAQWMETQKTSAAPAKG